MRFRRRQRGFLVAAGALAALLAICSTSLAGRSAPARASAATVTVTASDYSFKLSTKSAPAGKVTFSVKNAGKHDHDFKIAGEKTPVLKPGRSAKLVVTFTKAGRFTYTSTVSGDASKGMKGTFTTIATAPVSSNVAAGKQVFVTTGCGACHTMKAAGTTGTIASSLDKSKSSLATIKTIVASGKSSMQAYSTLLSPTQIEDVAEFVFQSRTG